MVLLTVCGHRHSEGRFAQQPTSAEGDSKTGSISHAKLTLHSIVLYLLVVHLLTQDMIIHILLIPPQRVQATLCAQSTCLVSKSFYKHSQKGSPQQKLTEQKVYIESQGPSCCLLNSSEDGNKSVHLNVVQPTSTYTAKHCLRWIMPS